GGAPPPSPSGPDWPWRARSRAAAPRALPPPGWFSRSPRLLVLETLATVSLPARDGDPRSSLLDPQPPQRLGSRTAAVRRAPPPAPLARPPTVVPPAHPGRPQPPHCRHQLHRPASRAAGEAVPAPPRLRIA